ncbi:MAG: protein translocase subunit SecF, partial [Chloroflexota bacterium]
SPLIASEIVRNAIIAVAAASVGILLYIAYAFRRVKNSFRWGTCAVLALVHDALIVLGTFSILGRVFHIELDSLFITAVMTVIGFSVHDTIVVFDRIRENYGRRSGDRLENIVNHSIMQTIGRSLNTSITTLLVLIALYMFGGVTIQNFVLALIIGIVVGTYSSIFVAASLLVVWEYGELKAGWKRLFGGKQAVNTAS